MKQDTITEEITVSKNIEEVWDALTTADGLASWFAGRAEIDLRPGGAMTLHWAEYDDKADCVVETVEPPSRFSYRWDLSRGRGDGWTLVTFELNATDAGTTVAVVESGLAALPDDIYPRALEENTSGWKSEMGDLLDFLSAA